MSQEYAEKRIKDALKLASGNAAHARNQVIIWALEDPKLLQALTKHHLTGIVAYHMERVASGRSTKPVNVPPPLTPSRPKAPPAGDSFGKEILKAVVDSNAAVFGLENGAVPPNRGQTSQRHVDAIRQMAREIKSKHRG